MPNRTMRKVFVLLMVLLASVTGGERLVAQSCEVHAAVGSNLLLDAALMPTLTAEVALGEHWSVMAEWTNPWWINEEKQRCLEMNLGTIEGRYWFKQTDKSGEWLPMHGHFMGLYGSVGRGDIEWDFKGTQCELVWTVGASYGYSFRLSHQFRLECSVGVGYMRAQDYNHYHCYELEGTRYLITHERGNYSWFGPTRAGVTLMWVPQLGKKTNKK